MATSKTIDRQPTKLDYASPTQFRFGINQLPKVEFFTVAANVPSIAMGDAIFGNDKPISLIFLSIGCIQSCIMLN